MELKKTNCTECGAPIAISDDVQYINCVACGTFFAVEHGEGYISLKAIEKLTKAIQDSGTGTQDVIRESAEVTRAELQRLQITQAIAMAEMKLNNLQAEIRGLERAQQTPKSIQQIQNLHGIEFNTMEELRKMHLSAAELGPQDLNSRIKNTEFHLNWLNSQKRVLSRSDFSYPLKKQVGTDIDMRIGQVGMEVFTLRTELIKGDLRSFNITTLPLDDLEKAHMFIQLANEDEARIRRMPTSPETQAILKELTERKKVVTNAWTQLENKRVTGMLSSPGMTVNQNELASLKNHLVLVNNDLNTVRQMPQNSVTSDYIKRLTQEQNALSKQIGKLEKDLLKAEERAWKIAQKSGVDIPPQASSSGAIKTGILAGFVLAITGMFAGIASLGKEIVGSISSRKQSMGETALDAQSSSVIQPTDIGQSATVGPYTAQSGYSISIAGEPRTSGLEFGSLVKGCLFGLLITIGISIIGLVIFGLAFSNSNNQDSYVGTGLFILAVAIGFALGSRVFLKNIAPLARVRGIGPKKNIIVHKQPKKPGLTNPLAVKGLVGLLTCLSAYLVFLSISMMLPQEAGFFGFCIGILLGPILGGIFSHRTYLAELQV